MNKDNKNFWKIWNSYFCKNCSNDVDIDGHSESSEIANAFARHFANSFVNSINDNQSVDEFVTLYQHVRNVVPETVIDISDVELCLSYLKMNKASGHDGLVAEHLMHSHPAIVLHMKILFQLIFKFSFVPDDFGVGVIVPIVKNYRGNLCSSDNYRPITLSPIISKVFEHFLLHKFSGNLRTDNLQFGFKKGLGCSNALFLLRQTIHFFTSHGSDIFIASLDASRAFDRVNHFKLYSTLIKSNVSSEFVRIIINWYSKLCANVKWFNCFSDSFTIHSGVRQGGILSPLLFNYYVDTLIINLRSSDLGCKLHNTYVGCIMYADDLLLISASIINLQNMLDICSNIGATLGIKFNSSKSCCLHIGPSILNVLPDLLINNSIISWCNKIKYLGIWIRSNSRFVIDIDECRSKFFMSVNRVLSKTKYICVI